MHRVSTLFTLCQLPSTVYTLRFHFYASTFSRILLRARRDASRLYIICPMPSALCPLPTFSPSKLIIGIIVPIPITLSLPLPGTFDFPVLPVKYKLADAVLFQRGII